MSTTTELQLKLEFEDGSTRLYTIPTVESGLTDTMVISRVNALNDGTNPDSSAFKSTFVTEDGDHCVSITSASIITTTEEEIYRG